MHQIGRAEEYTEGRIVSHLMGQHEALDHHSWKQTKHAAHTVHDPDPG